jgi:hypothetical protein
MKYFVLISATLFMLMSCSGKKYFDYDNIDHYFNNFDENKIGDLYDNKSNTELDSTKFEVITGDIPADLSDLTFINKLESIGYTKKGIDKSSFKNIDEIFTKKISFGRHANACVPIYRDILVFKKNDKVVGVAKICFHCEQNQIVGTMANTENFGQDGDYERLYKIIR